MEAMTRAREALVRGDHESALAALLEAWRATREPRIAGAISRVRLTAERPGGKTLAKKQEAWLTLEAKGQAKDVPSLVASLTEVRCAEAHARLKKLEAREDDPRVAEGLVELLRAPAYQGASSIEFWKDVCDLLVRVADSRQLKPLRSLHADLRYSGGGTAGRALGVLLQSVLKGVERRSKELARSLPKSAEADLAAVEAALAQGSPGSGASGDALYDAILANPGDDGARLVYADWLQERGDPRGEFIALQMQGASPKRQRELLRLHQKEWLGPLAPAVMKDGLRFERGFLDACRLMVTAIPLAEKLVGARELGTVRDLDVTAFGTLHYLLPLLQNPVMRALRVVRGADTRIFAAATPLPIEELEIGFVYGRPLEERLAKCTCLPRLRRLRLADSLLLPDRLTKIWSSRALANLKVLELPVVPGNVLGWLQEVVAAKLPLERLTLLPANDHTGWQLSIAGQDLEATPAGDPDFALLAGWILGVRPNAFRSLVVHAPADPSLAGTLAKHVATVEFKAPGARGR